MMVFGWLVMVASALLLITLVALPIGALLWLIGTRRL